MHYAAENGRVKGVNWLVEDGGMQISAVDAQGQTAMHYAANASSKWLIVKGLMKILTRMIQYMSLHESVL